MSASAQPPYERIIATVISVDQWRETSRWVVGSVQGRALLLNPRAAEAQRMMLRQAQHRAFDFSSVGIEPAEAIDG
jgi:hypothetical protein